MLRPQQMLWVDLVVRNDSINAAMETIAGTGMFEAEWTSQTEFDAWSEKQDSTTIVRELRAMLRPYRQYLPEPNIDATTEHERQSPFSHFSGNIRNQIEQWIETTRDDVHSLSELSAEREQLEDLEVALRIVPAELLLEHWRNTDVGDRIAQAVVAVGTKEDVERFIAASEKPFLRAHVREEEALGVVTGIVGRSDMNSLRLEMSQHQVRLLVLPEWVSGLPQEASHQVQKQLGKTDRRADEYQSRIDTSSEACRMDAMLWLIERENWINDKMEKVHRGAHFVHLGGWVPRDRYSDFVEALNVAAIPYLVRLDKRPEGLCAPSMLSNPGWVKQFELFVSGFGTPGADEVDPSLVIALLTPLMFGYMFGDVGQGLLLLIAGLLLRRRISWIGLLVPAGISSMIFGVLYGSVFSMETLIPALWLHPMEHPLVVLGVPLLLGMLMMLLSIAFSLVEARWRKRLNQWIFEELPLLLCYLATPLLFLVFELGLAMALIAIVILLFNNEHQGRSIAYRLGMLLPSLLDLLERWMQLMINTLSFTRLGAFALAHAGLSAALMSLVSLSDSWLVAGLVLVVGNLFITALEGLVVSIQTTRLVMFEFFRRFFQGTGRRFQPITLEGHPGSGGHSR